MQLYGFQCIQFTHVNVSFSSFENRTAVGVRLADELTNLFKLLEKIQIMYNLPTKNRNWFLVFTKVHKLMVVYMIIAIIKI